jgi:hypothetical protein
MSYIVFPQLHDIPSEALAQRPRIGAILGGRDFQEIHRNLCHLAILSLRDSEYPYVI